MTISGETIGRRIARYRRAAGIKTAADLAEQIDSFEVTTAILQNLESERKKSLTLVQLILIARALDIPVATLAVDLRDPFGPSEIADLSNWEIAQALAGESMTGRSAVSPSTRLGREEASRLAAIRELVNIREEWYRRELELGSDTTERGREALQFQQDTLRTWARKLHDVLQELETVDLTWARGPWLEGDS